MGNTVSYYVECLVTGVLANIYLALLYCIIRDVFKAWNHHPNHMQPSKQNKHSKNHIADRKRQVKLICADDVTGEIDYGQFQIREYPEHYHLIDIVNKVKRI